jgi:hypothetical protein
MLAAWTRVVLTISLGPTAGEIASDDQIIPTSPRTRISLAGLRVAK